VPSTEEIASTLGMTPEEISRNEEQTTRAAVLSLQATDAVDLEGMLPSAGPSPEQLAEHQELLTYMVEAVAELPHRLRTVVEQYFLAERPMAEIAAELGVTESRVSQIRAEALILLRGALNRELDPELEPRPAASQPAGCAVRRREAYYSAVATRHAASLGARAHAHRRLDEIA
jgi:RNA polymerase sigma factor for flagellar operon FliA